jgi:sugar lactone lactonase YvrE
VALPVKRPTACTFGGDQLQHLYVTTRVETGAWGR